MEGRRKLTFADLGEIMAEVDRLLDGHEALGDWSLGQVCNHLAGALVCSVDGFPEKFPWLVRKVVGPIARRRIIGRGRMPDGVKIPEKFRPGPGLDDRAEAEALRAAIRLFSAHPGPYAPHPMLGLLDGAGWRRFHCVHSAHHLGFLVPGPA